VFHIIYSLGRGAAVPIELIEENPNLSALIHDLPVGKVSVALWFCTSLAEEVGKTDANNIKQ
jgi:hypothetical protein